MNSPPLASGAPAPFARLRTQVQHRVRLHLELGRISNLPTVWTNVLAAAVLAGSAIDPGALLLAMLGFSALYIGGMYLNDAFDVEIDTRERPERPIPSGRISARAVTLGAAAWFVCGVLAIGLANALSGSTGNPYAWLPAALALIACIVVYDLNHKGNRYGPLLMAGCRALVYIAAALTLSGTLAPAVWVGASLAFGWVAGLTAFAKHEGDPDAAPSQLLRHWPLAVLTLPVLAAGPFMLAEPVLIGLGAALLFAVHRARAWMRRREAGDFPAAIGLLIAAISIVDALAIARVGHPMLAIAAASCVALTLLLQRRIAGT